MASRAIDVAILGLARDCERTIPKFLGLISALQATGISTLAIVGENGSRDDTRRLLLTAADRGLLRVEDTSFMATHGRFKRMALGREALKNALHETSVDAKVVCVVDLDGPMESPPDIASLNHAIARLLAEDTVFALAATSRPSYYDLIAFDDGQLSFDYLANEIRARESNPIRYYRLFKEIIYPAQSALTSDKALKCISAFNGLCLYRATDYLRGSYCAESQFDICEHLTFNRSLAAMTGKHMIVDPLLMVKMPPEHCRKSFFLFWAQRFQKLAQRL